MSVNEAGYVSVEMVPEPDTLLTSSPSRYGLVGFISGESFEQEQGGGITKLDPFSRNHCTRLELETPHGTFRTDDVPHYGREEDLYHGEVRSITFAVGQSQFEAAVAGDPKYWVLPLANFLSECRDWRGELDRHPLRIFPTPEVPDEVTHVPFGPDHDALMKRAWACLSTAHSKNRLIVFKFNEGPGFVERLPDYEVTKELLLEGKERRKTTGVMVGPTGNGPVESFERMRDWFPFDVLSLLTLATGMEVGCPWVEIRDDEGRLVEGRS